MGRPHVVPQSLDEIVYFAFLTNAFGGVHLFADTARNPLESSVAWQTRKPMKGG
ncbi:hypothetical protein [Burkholderia sp. Nafp2/4-1b]|uniref:hypothetical protein n=1 Tax=Burkholderia sp. Nafp2/4-1b TaxID=2116686 RepID=UPI001969CDCC|nr:hypothetical protein [Burkholderia sp. Nafp2/4-1b]